MEVSGLCARGIRLWTMCCGSEHIIRCNQIQKVGSRFYRKSFRDFFFFLDVFQLSRDECSEDKEQGSMEVLGDQQNIT